MRSLRLARRFAFGLTLTLLAACGGGAVEGPPVAGSEEEPRGSAAPPADAARAPLASATPPPASSAERAREASRARFASLVEELSEPDAYFFSDNLITNETSYLQVADELAARADPQGVYVGVGPEQNFTYIAATRPRLAFVVDIRRGNLLVHLLHRAAFEEASSRADYLALLLGRPFDAERAPGPEASLDQVLAAATAGAPTPATLEAAHARLRRRIDAWGLRLGPQDHEALAAAHASFHRGGLGLRFSLHQKNGRSYPTFGELLAAKSPSGQHGSFLATEESFRFVQDMQRDGRIVPLVGDFAGERALPQLAAYLRSEGLAVSTFYVSNVEQYLLEPSTWQRWVRNADGLPRTAGAVFVRAYLDQGARHPAQREGHRTATVLAELGDLRSRWGTRPAPSFLALSSEGRLGAR